MAKLYITAYKQPDYLPAGQLPVAREPGTDQVVTFSGETKSNVFGDGTTVIRLISDTDCHIQFGTNPTADSNKQFLPANVVEWRGVRVNDKVSVIAA